VCRLDFVDFLGLTFRMLCLGVRVSVISEGTSIMLDIREKGGG